MKKIITLILLVTAAYFQSSAQGLVINEVDYDQPSVDSAEFIELYNSGSTPVNLGSVWVILYNGNISTGGIYDSFPLPPQMLNPGAYFVICGGGGLVPLCDMVRPAVTNLLQNGSPDGIALIDTTTSIFLDAVSYEGNCPPPYISGNGVPLAQSDTGNTGFVSIGRFPDGTDTNDDSTDFHRACVTPGAANVNVSTGCGPVSVKTVSAKNQLSIYPNPSKGLVHVEMVGGQFRNASLTVSNLLGKEMKTVNVKNNESNYQLDISEFQDGIYFVKVKSDAGESIHRVILKK